MLVSRTNPGELKLFFLLNRFFVAIILHFYLLSERKRSIASTSLKISHDLDKDKENNNKKKHIYKLKRRSVMVVVRVH